MRIGKILSRLWQNDDVKGRTMARNRRIVSHALRSLNCDYHWEKSKDSKLVRFDFQSGHFTIRLDSNHPYVRLVYPFFCETEMENADIVRLLCNKFNLDAHLVRFLYTVDGKTNQVGMHMGCDLLLYDHNAVFVLSDAMTDIFGWQLSFSRQLRDLEQQKQRNGVGDVELTGGQIARELFLIREQELSHQRVAKGWRGSDKMSITLRQWMDEAFGLDDFTAEKLLFTLPEARELTDAEAINGLDLSQIMIADGKFKADNVMFLLTFSQAKAPKEKREVVFLMQQQGTSEHTLYYRVTATLLSIGVSPGTPVRSKSNVPESRSALIGFDVQPDSRRLSEFEYISKEAQAKLEEGKIEEMTADERIIADCTNGSVALRLYQGRRFFMAGRWLEALQWLGDAFAYLHRHVAELSAMQRDSFFEVCYMMGFCHTELRQYAKAYYYLAFTLGINRVNYTEEYINCLANSHDYRALPFIEGMLNNLQQISEENGEDGNLPEELDGFQHFLIRRKAYVLIDMNRLDEASKLLMTMLDDPENGNFALTELSYIQRLRDKKKGEDASNKSSDKV